MNVSIFDQAHMALKRAIMDADIYGHRQEIRLDERQLNLAVGVSRTPIREAMTLLEQEGFLRTAPRPGIFIVWKTKKEIIEVCAALASMAARLATTSTSPEVRAEAEALVELLRSVYLAALGEGGTVKKGWTPAKKAAMVAKMKPNERIAELETQLAAEKTARAEAEQKAAVNRVHDTIQTEASVIGARQNALDIISGKGDALFTVVNGVVQAKPNTFSKKRPGELLTVDEWLAETAREFPFLFMPSNGCGTPSAAKRWRWRRHGRCAGAS